MNKDYELSVSSMNNNDASIDATVSLRNTALAAFGEIFTINCTIEKVEGVAFSYYEEEAISKVREYLKHIASSL